MLHVVLSGLLVINILTLNEEELLQPLRWLPRPPHWGAEQAFARKNHHMIPPQQGRKMEQMEDRVLTSNWQKSASQQSYLLADFDRSRLISRDYDIAPVERLLSWDYCTSWKKAATY